MSDGNPNLPPYYKVHIHVIKVADFFDGGIPADINAQHVSNHYLSPQSDYRSRILEAVNGQQKEI